MIALRWDNELGAGRLQRDEHGALALDSSLETAVLLSLFTDREATEEEIALAGLTQQRGWWADADSLRDPGRPRLGSKLWLLSRGKTTLETLRRAEKYAAESLRWLVDQGIAAKVAVLATRPGSGIVSLDVTIIRPNKLLPPYKRLWEMRTDAMV